ncbi:MAG TPA: nicotinate-nucleotide adenylyltransferase [Anaerolineales bacterium]|nr:nicotinate-nucleotide adenylyltransferase [Anaerolineales bacterium]
MPDKHHERVGLFGGTFDPPHVGHLILASEAKSQLELTRVLWTVTPDPPHKQDQWITSLEHRLAMVKLAIEDEPAFELSDIELNRPGPHYTLDTIKLLAEQNPGAEIVPIIGGDSLNDLPTWHKPKEILYAAHWVGVMRRPGEQTNLQELERELPGITSKVHYVDAPLLEIASREIRNRVAAGKPFRYYLPEPVYEYIEQHHLYHQSQVSNHQSTIVNHQH